MSQSLSTTQTSDAVWPTGLVSSRAVGVVRASYISSAVDVDEYARAVIEYARSGPEVARRALMRRRQDILRDSWGPLLRAALRAWLHPDVYRRVVGVNGDHLDLSRNPAKNIWQELAVVYKLPPRRSTQNNPRNGELYNELLADTGMDLHWQMFEVLLNACNEVLVWPAVVTRPNGDVVVKHRYATGSTVTLVTSESDPTEIEAVLICDEYADVRGGRHERYYLWTDAWHVAYEYGVATRGSSRLSRVGRVLPAGDDAPSELNAYGRIPQVVMRLTPWQDTPWDTTSGEDLVDLTLRGGEERQLYRYQQKMGGFKQLAAVGDIDEVPEQILDPGDVLKFPGQGSVTVLDWQTDLKERLDCMMTDELAAAAAKGINPERYKRTASYQTSFGARLSERGLSERRVRNVPIFVSAEAEYYRVFCEVARVHGIPNVPDPSDRLVVEHAPMSYPEDPGQQVNVDAMELSLALVNHVELIQRRKPELTSEQAMQILEHNLEVVARVSEMKASHNVPTDPTVESASAEENGALGTPARETNSEENA